MTNSFDKILEIAYDAASVYETTNASSIPEAILKLNILGMSDEADNFEKGLKYINEET